MVSKEQFGSNEYQLWQNMSQILDKRSQNKNLTFDKAVEMHFNKSQKININYYKDINLDECTHLRGPQLG